MARNTIARGNCGLSPSALVLGSQQALPGEEDILAREYNGDVLHEQTQLDELKNRQLARLIYLEQEARAKISRALRQQLRPSRAPVTRGDCVLFFRALSSLRPSRGTWNGPATVLNAEGSQVWIVYQGKTLKVPPEFVRALSADEQHVAQELVRLNESADKPLLDEGTLNDLPRTPVPEVASQGRLPRTPVPEVASQGRLPRTPVPESASQIRLPKGASTSSRPFAGVELQEPPLKQARIKENLLVDLPDAPDSDHEDSLVASTFREEVLTASTQVFEFELAFTAAKLDALAADVAGKSCREVILSRLKRHARTTHAQVTERQMTDEDRKLFLEAKSKEWQSWIAKKVVELASRGDIPNNRLLRSRWVLSWKKVPGTQDRKAKARLVILGFEDPDLATLRTDSPTATRSTKLLLMQLSLQMDWLMFSLDAHTAFLSGDNFEDQSKEKHATGITRHRHREMELYFEPPSDLKAGLQLTSQEALVLRKCAYGLADAPRSWYKKLSRILLGLSFVQSEHDPCLFMLRDETESYTQQHETSLCGAIALHVDDLLCAGGGAKWDQTMKKLESRLHFGEREWKEFTYTGVRVFQDEQQVRLEQSDYTTGLTELHIPKGSEDDATVSASSTRLIKQCLGELQWACTQTRPDLAAETSILSSAANAASVGQVKRINKLLRRAAQSEVSLILRKLPDKLTNLQWLVVSDAAYGVRDKGMSQAGGLVFLTTGAIANAELAPVSLIDWTSTKITRVVRSSFAAETQAAVTALETLEALQAKWDELVYGTTCRCFRESGPSIPGNLVVDCRGLYSHLIAEQAVKPSTSTGSVLDVLMLRQLVQNTRTTWWWVNSEHMIADSLTKVGNARHDLLLKVMRNQHYRISYSTLSGKREKATRALLHEEVQDAAVADNEDDENANVTM
eukprot:1859779-Amphidinium_carterae.2